MVSFWAVPPHFQYQNEKTWSANKQLFYTTNVLEKPALVGCNSFFIWVWKSGVTIQKHVQVSVKTPFSWAYGWGHLIGLELMVWKEGLEKSGGELTPAVRHNRVAVPVALVDRWRWLCCLVDCGTCFAGREWYWIDSADIVDCGIYVVMLCK